MTDPASSTDTSLLDRLAELEERLRVVSDRLARLDELRDEISEPVYRRVRDDYQGRRQEIETEIGPLREQAGGVRAQAAEVVERLTESLAAIRLEEEELNLRCSLGELTQDEVGDRLARLGEERERLTGELAEAEALAGRLASMLDDHPAVDGAPRQAAPEHRREPPPSVPEPPSAPEPSPEPDRAPPAEPDPSAPPPGATVYLPSVPEGAEPAAGGTRLLRFAVLVPEDPATGGPSEYRIGPLTAVGRTAANQIQLDDVSVSRRHAQISLTDRGFVLRDLGSQNGCFVNGERIDERLLEDGDRVLIGTVPLLFHASRS